MSLLVVDALVGAARVDVRVAGGRVAAVAPRLEPRRGEAVVAAGGGALLPGLHDHHLHLRSAAAARSSVVVGPPEVTDRPAMAARLAAAAARVPPGGWVRAVGYHESVAGPLDRWALDAMVADRPVRVQHRTGALWVLNSLAARQVGLDDPALGSLAGVERGADGRPDGRLFRLDRWLGERVPRLPVGIEALSAEAAARGVTGLTEATAGLGHEEVRDLVSLVESGEICQRLCVMCPPGVDVPAHPMVTRGPVKVLLDDDTIPTPTDLAAEVRRAHGSGLPVAVHCVTALQLVVALQAFDEAGARPGDRVEHASVVPAALVGAIVRLGLTVVTNPAFVAERGDRYLADVDPAERGDLYRCRSLADAGVPLAAGTDAPFGPLDPWVAVRAAVTRTTASGALLGGDEAVPFDAAVGLFLGPADAPGRRRTVTVGAPGDLCLLDPGDKVGVAATIVAGRLVFRAGGQESRTWGHEGEEERP
ncbi:MAG TPA: amidohydrolase family protein [Acidimicrobiales bacterium]|nr:amidohydrolase family protein [Acidimicrobiales bacterium]